MSSLTFYLMYTSDLYFVKKISPKHNTFFFNFLKFYFVLIFFSGYKNYKKKHFHIQS